jgi:hypothetical protein
MKKIHLLLGILLLLLFLCCMNIESFGNPFDKPFMQQKNNNTDFKNESICKDDMTWKNKDKSCRDYSIIGADCSDVGDNGVVAFDACRVACDNCPRSVEIKIRQPSPSADYAEPPYSTFEGPQGEFMSEGGSADFREIFTKLGEIEEKIETTSSERLELSEIEGALDRQTFILSPRHWPKPCHEYTRVKCPTAGDNCRLAPEGTIEERTGRYECLAVNENSEKFDTCWGRMELKNLPDTFDDFFGDGGGGEGITKANMHCSELDIEDLGDFADNTFSGDRTLTFPGQSAISAADLTCEMFQDADGYKCITRPGDSSTSTTGDIEDGGKCMRGTKCKQSFIYDMDQISTNEINVCELQGLIEATSFMEDSAYGTSIFGGVDRSDITSCENIEILEIRDLYPDARCDHFYVNGANGASPCMDAPGSGTFGNDVDLENIRCITVKPGDDYCGNVDCEGGKLKCNQRIDIN